MSAEFPAGVYTPRTKANRNGVVYDPNKSTVAYAEDLQALDAEIVAVENELGANPKGAYESVAAYLAALAQAIGNGGGSWEPVRGADDNYVTDNEKLSLCLIANDYAGADIGAKINAAYLALPADGGVIKIIKGSYTFSTPIVMGTASKPALVVGEEGGGTQLTYSGTGTCILLDCGNGHGRGGGLKGFMLTGPSRAGVTVGIKIGGANDNEGIALCDLTVSGFGTGLTFDSNAYINNLDNISLVNNGCNVLFPAGFNNWGESINFNGGNISNDTAGIGTYHLASIKITSQDFLSVSFNSCSIDNAQIDVQSTEGLINVNLNGCHFENPGADAVAEYPFIKNAAPTGDAARNVVNIVNTVFLFQATDADSTPDQYILNNGTLRLINCSAEVGGGVIPNFITGTGDVYNFGFMCNQFWNGSEMLDTVTNFCNDSPSAPLSIFKAGVQVYAVDYNGNVSGGSGVSLAENTGITMPTSLSADGSFCGEIIAGIAGRVMYPGDSIYLDPTDGRWEYTDANSAAGADGDARGLVGMCIQYAAADGDAINILLRGFIRADDGFPTLTKGAPVYASEDAGIITQTAPSTTGAVRRVLGFGYDANTMYYCPDNSFTVA